MRPPVLKSDAARLFTLSFALLFWELVCIRWLAAYVLYLGYFTNFVLLGALLGIGAGALLAPRSQRLIAWLPLVMFGFFSLVPFIRAEVRPEVEDYIFFTSTLGGLQLPPYITLPIIFLSVTAIFTLMAQDLGGLFARFEPLQAYNYNLLGSLAGIVAFTLLSFLSAPAWTWFLLGCVTLLLLVPDDRTWGRNALLLGGVVCVIGTTDFIFNNLWSPYYRLNLIVREQGLFLNPTAPNPRGTYLITANGAGHQVTSPVDDLEDYYRLPYTAFPVTPTFASVLVIGAGNGNDVATALKYGAQQIDAVEIDPQIVELGRRFHPENPYSDPRVTVYIDDARSFLEKTDKQYDLIVFALPDSLVLASSFGSLRLESYLFTAEAFQSVQRHLRPDGMVVMYNYYRYDWLMDKLLAMLRTNVGEPIFHQSNDPIHKAVAFASLFAGPRAAEIDMTQPGFSQRPPAEFVQATDNWPFLYMREPALPDFYSLTLLLILVFSGLYIWRVAPQGALNLGHGPFFFMGAAFALLETRSIIQLLLLFGSTWLVNSLAFFAILLMVLLANAIVMRFQFKNVTWLMVLLAVALAVNFLLPIKTLLVDPPVLRYALAIVLLFSPIFLANLIYSTLFRTVPQPSTAFGANLLGTMVGGAAEYLSLYFGYQNLMIFVALFYGVAMLLLLRRAKTGTAAA